MTSNREYTEPDQPDGTPAPLREFVEWSINFSAVVFNTGFAFLAIATLCGIVFITRPKQVMHDIPLAVVPGVHGPRPCHLR